MSSNELANRRIVLAARPQGRPTPDDFRLEQTRLPTLADGELLLRTLYLSLDPYMRNLMDEAGTSYASAIPIGQPIVGGTVSRVVVSKHPQFRAGDLVLGNAGWQEHAVSDGKELSPLGDMPQPSLALGALGMPAFTAYVGLLDIGQPKQGETVVVAGATGAVGAMVGQIARIKGARVVGIAGGADKCRHAVETLGFDACIDRHDPLLAARLADACPKGIDVYFENVGGEVFDAVLPLLNLHARVPVCGFIAHYNDHAPTAGPDRLPRVTSAILMKRIRMQGFIILDHYADRFEAFRRDMATWIADGRVKAIEHVVDGLESAPEAFIGLLEGQNVGKLVVRVAQD
ncbi:NADP-dependent oxidoreductase [Dyella silvae]|uniref:NADP-dependent oxidoreductase n=1 Tax=Dyella silvae TaxID=2994424 RepID=UPI00226491A5|nr:NADP-dependent oxidoreductase [Dyella silvae]